MCSAFAERDVWLRQVMRPPGVMCACGYVSGTHHITLRQSRKPSLFAKQTASLAPAAQTSLYNHMPHGILLKDSGGTK